MKIQMFILMIIFSLLALPLFAIADEARTIEIRVAKNDTLLGLSNNYLQQPEKWQVIALLNRLENPDFLTPGQKIVIPVEMLKGISLEGWVTFLKGAAFAKGTEEVEWKPLHRGDVVAVGSSLKSGTKSSVEVTFKDGTAFFLRERTIITVKSASEGPWHLLRVLALKTGKVISRIKSVTGRDSRFEIETPSALAAARGTEYRVSVDEHNTTRAEMLENSIVLSSMGTTVPLRRDEGSVAKFNTPPTPPRKLLPPPHPANLRSNYETLPITISFTPVEGASLYRVVLAKDREGKNSVAEAFIQPDGTLEAAPTTVGIYYLLASSIDAEGLEGRLSEPQKVVLNRIRKKPETPAIIWPKNAALLETLQPAIIWQQLAKTSRYHLQIATDRDCVRLVADTAVVAHKKMIGGIAYTPETLAPGVYYFRVRSEEADGFSGDWSTIREFRVQ